MKTISKKAEKDLEAVAKRLGVPKENALSRAVSFYRRHLATDTLRKELLAWDEVSTADFAAFEKKI
jgi:hypothetical protein